MIKTMWSSKACYHRIAPICQILFTLLFVCRTQKDQVITWSMMRAYALYQKSGTVLLSPRGVSSPLTSLTAVFGMGTGVTSSLKAPSKPVVRINSPPAKLDVFVIGFCLICITKVVGFASTNCQPLFCKVIKSQSSISTPRLNTLLCVHLVPINHIVYMETNGEI